VTRLFRQKRESHNFQTLKMPATDNKVCPFLGLREDPPTCTGYPSPWNLCHHCKPACNVRMSHQRNICLTPAYAGCPVYQSPEGLPLPGDLRGRHGRVDQSAHGRK
jgi:hypothetical protein